MRAVSMHRRTPSGPRAMSTPSASSTSALPDRLEAARFPCFATGMPAPAATMAAAVEILKVPARSPPVPQVSMVPSGTSSGVAWVRIDSTNPVISSTVSPLARRAIKRPAVWTGVASPAITWSMTSRACSRVSAVPLSSCSIASLNGVATGPEILRRPAPGFGSLPQKKKWGPSSGGLGTGTPRHSIGKSRRILSSHSHWFLTPVRAGRSILGELPQAVGDFVRIQHERVFERGTEGHRRHIRTGNPDDGRIQAGEAALGELSSNLGPESAGPIGLIDDSDASGFAGGASTAVDIPGTQGSQIDDLHIDAVLAQAAGGLHGDGPHISIGDRGQVATRSGDHRGAQRQESSLTIRDVLPLSPVELFGLEKDHGIRIADRRLQQAFRLRGGRRQDDLQPGHVTVEGLGRLRVIERATNAAAGGRPNHQRTGKVTVGAVADAGDLIDDLVEGGIAVIRELHFSDRQESLERQALGHGGDAGL